MRRLTILLLAGTVLIAAAAVSAQTRSGFDLAGALVPADQILSDGPHRDGIPAIDRPRFVTKISYAEFVFCLLPDQLRCSVSISGQAT